MGHSKTMRFRFIGLVKAMRATMISCGRWCAPNSQNSLDYFNHNRKIRPPDGMLCTPEHSVSSCVHDNAHQLGQKGERHTAIDGDVAIASA